MILAFCLLTLLVSANTCSAAIKGGPRIIQEPAVIQDVSQPLIHVSKGGGGGAIHHTAVVQDPISGPVVIEKVSRVGGIKTAGLGAGSAQFTLGDGVFGQRRLYRAGPASYPFGLTGLDYYSYPNSLLTAPRLSRGKTVVSPNLSGLRPIGLSSGLKGGVIADPTISQFSIGDAQIKTNVFGARRNIYRTGLSPVPFGLMGLDYHSYPNNLLLQRSIDDGFGLRQTKILGGGSAFTAGDSQIRGPVVVAQSPVVSPLGQEKVTVVESDPLEGIQRVTTVQKAPTLGAIALGGPSVKTAQQVIPQQVSVLDDGLGEEFGQRKVTTTTITESADPIAAALGEQQITQTTVTKGGSGLSGLRGGQIILGGGPRIGGLRRVKTRPVIQEPAVVIQETSGLAPAIGGFGQRQVTLTQAAPAPVVQAPIIAQAPARILQAPIRVAPAPIVQAPVPIVQRPVITRGPGDVFLSQVARPQIATFARPAPIAVPIAQQRVLAPAPVAVPIAQQRVIAPAPISVPFAQQRVLAPAPVPVPIAQQRVLAPAPVTVPIAQQRVIAPAAPFFGGGNIQFTLGGSQLIGGPIVAPAPVVAAPRPVVVAQAPRFVAQAPRQVVVAEAPRQVVVAEAPRQVVVAQAPRFVAQAPRQVVVAEAPRQVVVAEAPRQVVVAQAPRFVAQAPRQVVVAQRPAVVAQAPVVVEQRPQILSQVKTSPGLLGNRRIFGRRIPQMVYVDGGNQFLGIDIVGGSRIGDPRFNYARLPYSAGRFSTLGSLSQARIPVSSFTSIDGQGSIDAGPTLVAPAPLPVIASLRKSPVLSVASPVAKTVSRVAAPLGLSPVGHTSSQVVTQEEVIGPVGDRQIVTTVTKSEPTIVSGPSKIGGAVVSSPLGLTAVGHTSPTKTITQEEVVGLGGDRQVVTTVTETDSNRLVGSKIGGAVVSSPFGLTAVGQAPTKTITQEEVVGPLGDSQIVTTVTKTEQAPVVVGPSKIGGFATGGLAAVGRAPTKVVTQEEVVGPAGDSQILTTVTQTDSNRLVGSKIGGGVVSNPFGLTAVGQAPTKTITQEEVVGPLGDSQIVTTVTKTEQAPVVVGPSKIGGFATGGLAAVGRAPTKVVTQEEVVGPAGDSQILTTVTETDSNRLVGSKIGGGVVSNPFGLTAVGQAPTKTITQEEVVGPLGDSQIVTTVTKTEQAPVVVGPSKIGGLATGGPLGVAAIARSAPAAIVQQEEVLNPITGLRTTSQLTQEITQDPIETAISQAKLATPFSQALVDPLVSGQTNIIDSDPITQVRETTYSEPLSGTVTKVTEVSNAAPVSSIVQQNIADTVVQESISPVIGGGVRFSPRVTFLSQHPYDVPGGDILRSIVTRPVIQQQQELEQILVKK